MPTRRHHTSPNRVSLAEMIKDQQSRLTFLQSNKDRKVAAGEITEWQANHKIALQEAVIKLLKIEMKKNELF